MDTVIARSLTGKANCRLTSEAVLQRSQASNDRLVRTVLATDGTQAAGLIAAANRT